MPSSILYSLHGLEHALRKDPEKDVAFTHTKCRIPKAEIHPGLIKSGTGPNLKQRKSLLAKMLIKTPIKSSR